MQKSVANQSLVCAAVRAVNELDLKDKGIKGVATLQETRKQAHTNRPKDLLLSQNLASGQERVSFCLVRSSKRGVRGRIKAAFNEGMSDVNLVGWGRFL